MNAGDPLTISYLKGEISFSDYANIIENQNLKNELFSDNVIEYASTSGIGLGVVASTSSDSDKHKKKTKDNKPMTSLDDYLDTDDEMDDEIWQDFDIGTLNFDMFIDSNNKSTDEEPPSTSTLNSRTRDNSKRRKSLKTDDKADVKSKRRRNKVLPIEMQGLMGEANLAYARGETNRSIDICTEVIKRAPSASEPFQLLSLLYSEIGDNDKALRVGLIAAQLNKDADEWIQLIHQSIMEGNEEIVLFCYTNAIQCNPRNIDLHLERIRLLQDRNDTKRLTLAKMMLLKYVDIGDNIDVYNKHFNELMAELDDDTDKYKKIYILKNDMNKFKKQFPVDRLVCLIKLLIDQKSYKESIVLMMNQCQIKAKGYLNAQIPLNFYKLNEIE
jgi:tetratricopeptide (TPR) repeat protein